MHDSVRARSTEEVRARLRRVAGQVQGLQRMVQEERYCIDVLTQLLSVRRALQEVALILVRGHLRACVARAMRRGRPEERERVIDEVLSALARVDR